jgi:hypothetical protein
MRGSEDARKRRCEEAKMRGSEDARKRRCKEAKMRGSEDARKDERQKKVFLLVFVGFVPFGFS